MRVRLFLSFILTLVMIGVITTAEDVDFDLDELWDDETPRTFGWYFESSDSQTWQAVQKFYPTTNSIRQVLS